MIFWKGQAWGGPERFVLDTYQDLFARDPDPYEGSTGAARVWGRHDYPPVNALLEFPR